MPPKTNPLKLNNLQNRTLVLVQVLANDPAIGLKDEDTGEVRLARLPHAHGDHVHVGKFVVSAKEASGFTNPAVWVALKRKGLVRTDDEAGTVFVTPEGLSYDTGLSHHFLEESDH